MLYAVRGRLGFRLSKELDAAYSLVLRVKSDAPKQGNLQYPRGAEIEVVKDELGIYDGHTRLFWAATSSGRFMANEVVEYGAEASPVGGPWGAWGEPGYAMRLIFFGDEPGTEIGMGDSPRDRLTFVGLPTQSPFNEEKLLFRRTVDGATADASELLDAPFTEDLIYERGRGLVSLIQTVENQPSMTWTLTAFHPPEERQR